MDDFLTFLYSRNIEEECIKKLENDKIDEKVVVLMDINQLEKYIPTYGDRLAVIDFCNRKLGTNQQKKQSLIQKIREKISGKRDVENDLPLPINPRQLTRKVELGWLNWSYDSKRYVQVRTKQGGGTRLLGLKKSDKKEEILNCAKNLFFPNGHSTKGALSSFSVDVFDFSNTSLEDNITVGQMYDVTGLPKLRFYLATKKKESVPTSTITSRQFYESVGFTSSDCCINDPDYDLYNPLHYVDADVTVEQSSLPEVVRSAGDTTENYTPQKTITLHRGRVMDGMIEAFSEDADYSNFVIEMVLPNGETERAIDTGGVFRDCLSEFWHTFYETCTVGTRAKVPCIRHDFSEKSWCAVAKILKTGWERVKYFPHKLAAPVLEYSIFGEVKSDLSDTLLKYVSAPEEDTINKALVDFESVDEDDIFDIMDNLDSKWKPNSSNFKQLLGDIAHKEMIQKPKFVIDSWRTELQNMMTTCELEQVLSCVLPLPKNILPMLQVNEGENGKNAEVFRYLKRFVREGDEKVLSSFLRFCTGADNVTDNKITVEFKEETGYKRTPVAHTCSCTLQLPNSYASFPEFRYELNSVLSSNIWVMDII